MSDTSDDYAAFDFSEFTPEDFEQIDADLALRVGRLKGGPHVTIQLEPPVEPSVGHSKRGERHDELSPMHRHRRHGTLSVTDIASPAWCEVQFDYGLRQKRSRPLESRPDSFVSAEGKEIHVEKVIAAKNSEITKQGIAVHKELEREIWSEEIRVDITSDEELWALRLVNMLACLRCIIFQGLTREMPVFGVLDGQVVVGIIDEITRKPQPGPPAALQGKCLSEPSRSTPKPESYPAKPSSSQPRITEFLPSSVENASPTRPVLANEECSSAPSPENSPNTDAPRNQYMLCLTDTKTRRTYSLPLDEDTLPSRLQLMLYHRLLNELISTRQPFDFTSLWQQLELNSSKAFSPRFLLQVGLNTENAGSPKCCLDDLAQAWIDMVPQLDVSGVDTILQLTYRMQSRIAKRKLKGKTQIQASNSHNELTLEDQDLARAIEASLDNIHHSTPDIEFGNVSAANERHASGSPQDKHSVNDRFDMPSILGGGSLNRSGDPTRRGIPTIEISATKAGLPKEEDQTVNDMTIIGTKQFKADEVLLNEHVGHTLQWWYGQRKPQGVSLKISGRCFSCEYETHCEWRERKALEFTESVRSQRRVT